MLPQKLTIEQAVLERRSAWAHARSLQMAEDAAAAEAQERREAEALAQVLAALPVSIPEEMCECEEQGPSTYRITILPAGKEKNSDGDPTKPYLWADAKFEAASDPPILTMNMNSWFLRQFSWSQDGWVGLAESLALCMTGVNIQPPRTLADDLADRLALLGDVAEEVNDGIDGCKISVRFTIHSHDYVSANRPALIEALRKTGFTAVRFPNRPVSGLWEKSEGDLASFTVFDSAMTDEDAKEGADD